MNKEIHFYEYGDKIPMFHSWNETEIQIENGKNYIKTTQMGLLSTRLFELGYRIFVHESYDSAYEIELDGDNDLIKEINLFKLWQDGEFEKRKEHYEQNNYI